MVLGKFLAAFSMFFGCMMVSCLNFIPLYAIAATERGTTNGVAYVGPVTAEIVGSMIGIILIGAAFIAIGTFISSVTENQLAAAIITIAVILVLVGVGLLSSFIDIYWIRATLSWISVIGRFSNFSTGIFDISVLVYFASLTFLFVFLTVRVYEKRRWS